MSLTSNKYREEEQLDECWNITKESRGTDSWFLWGHVPPCRHLCKKWIVVNTAVDFIRKNRKEFAVDEVYETGKEDTYKDFDTIQALNVLDEKERAVIVLRFFEDQKLKDIAGILNENTNTVKTILYRGLKKLKIELTEGEPGYEG